jgi:hypothetical protein
MIRMAHEATILRIATATAFALLPMGSGNPNPRCASIFLGC